MMIDKYRCQECGEVFDEDEVLTETEIESRGEYFGRPAYEPYTYMKCPNCRSENIEEYDEFEDFLDEDEF